MPPPPLPPAPCRGMVPIPANLCISHLGIELENTVGVVVGIQPRYNGVRFFPLFLGWHYLPRVKSTSIPPCETQPSYWTERRVNRLQPTMHKTSFYVQYSAKMKTKNEQTRRKPLIGWGIGTCARWGRYEKSQNVSRSA